MRDFRVTTIFEGTTEIHSIYPALLGMKQLGDEIKKQAGLTRLLFLGKSLLSSFGNSGWPAAPQDPLQKRAFREAKRLARMLRRRILMGVMIYGKTLVNREFLLRRITVLSLYLFGILSILAKLARDRQTGVMDSQDRERLAWFLDEAVTAGKDHGRFRDSRREKALIGQNLIS